MFDDFFDAELNKGIFEQGEAAFNIVEFCTSNLGTTFEIYPVTRDGVIEVIDAGSFAFTPFFDFDTGRFVTQWNVVKNDIRDGFKFSV